MKSQAAAETQKERRDREKGILHELSITPGERFGKLRTLTLNGENKWQCICDCGNERFCYAEELKRTDNPVKSCAECEYEVVDFAGHRFGRLQVIGRSDQRERGNVKWKCLCDCGNVIYRSHRLLKAGGNHASCGCLISKVRSESFHKPNQMVNGTNIALLENTKLRSDNKSGLCGVHWSTQKGKWKAEIRLRGKCYHLGFFDAILEAESAYAEAKEKIHQPVIDAFYANAAAT